MVVQQLVAILVLFQEEMSAQPSTPSSWIHIFFFFLICAARLVIPNPSMYSSRLSSLSAYQLLNWFSVIWFISMRRTHYFTSNAILLYWKYVIFTSGLFKQISPFGKCLILSQLLIQTKKVIYRLLCKTLW